MLLLDEVTAYMMNAWDNLKSAKILFDAGQYRNSIPLSFYAMYLAVKALTLKLGFNSKSQGGTIKFFSMKYVHESDFNPDIFAYLGGSQSLRHDADYTVKSTHSKEIAEEEIEHAEKFLIEAERFL